jgi:hypothetical protein
MNTEAEETTALKVVIKQHSEDTEYWEGLVHTAVHCEVCELVKRLQLLLVTICEIPINPITNQTRICSH